MCAPASRAFSSTAMAGGSPPADFWSCARRSAAESPAGPAPTISTSTSSVSRGMDDAACLYGLFLQFSDNRRHDLEQVAGNAVVGDFEDRRVRVLVDGNDGPRALHADDVLNRAGDTERDVELGRHGLARAADLPLHRQPARIADRTRRGQLGAERLGQLLRHRQVLLPLDAAADRDNPLGLREIDRLLRFLKRRLRLLADG